MEPQQFIVVLTNLPDRPAALRLADALVRRRLAACVNVLEACISVYRWQDNIEVQPEVPVFIKTRAALFSAVEGAIRELHPYELPEIVAVPVQAGSAAYLAWLAEETGKPS